MTAYAESRQTHMTIDFTHTGKGNNTRTPVAVLVFYLDGHTLTAGDYSVGSTVEIKDGDDVLFSTYIYIAGSGQLTIQSNIELMGNSSVIVEAGGKLIIDGGTLSNVDLVLKAGATLQLKNGGILETRNGFDAPVGAIVNMEYGQIL